MVRFHIPKPRDRSQLPLPEGQRTRLGGYLFQLESAITEVQDNSARVSPNSRSGHLYEVRRGATFRPVGSLLFQPMSISNIAKLRDLENSPQYGLNLARKFVE